jgi:hypothetical protein
VPIFAPEHRLADLAHLLTGFVGAGLTFASLRPILRLAVLLAGA